MLSDTERHIRASVGRREFVKTSGLLVGGAVASTSALASLAVARGAWGATGGSDKLRIGLIGCGGRGSGAAVQALSADPGTVLVAAGDVFEDRLKSALANIEQEMGDDAPNRVQVPAGKRFVGFDNYRHVVDSGVDVVLLTSYPCFRPAHLKYAIDAGKHVFAEKPLAVDGPGIRSVLESAAAARAKNLALLVGFCWRFNAGMRGVFSKINSGAIGDIVTVHTTYHTGTLSKRPRQPGWGDLEFQMRNWWHHTWVGGDHIVEQAVHSVDRLAWAMNDRKPSRVICLGGRAAREGVEHGDVYDHFSAAYEYDQGECGAVRAFHACRQIDNCPTDNTDYVYGTKGSAAVNGWTGSFPIRDLSGGIMWEGKGSPDDAGKMYFDEHKELFASIRAGKPINDCERGANSCLMAIMARMAAYTGQTVSWEQALNSTESLVPPEDQLRFDGPAPVVEVAIPGKKKFA